MRSSIRQVAEQAQVSPMTVSRVLQGRKNQVNEETYRRVLAAIQQLNYVPVRPVVQNRHTETNTIALVPYYVKPSRSAIDSVTFEGLCEQAGHSGYDLTIMLRGEAEWMAKREEMRFLDRRSDGFIFISPGCGEWRTTFDALVRHSIPTVVCYRRDVPAGVAWVDPDNEAIMRLALDCLIRAGHRDIAYVAGPRPDRSDNERLPNLSAAAPGFDNQERQRYFEEITGARGLKKSSRRIIWTGDAGWVFSAREFGDLLAAGATGVICGDHQALQLLDHAEAFGVCVPYDLSIIGIDNEVAAAHRGLTSVGFGYDTVGRLAVQSWLELKRGKDSRDCCKVVPVALQERKTVAPPRPKGVRQWKSTVDSL